MKKVLFLITGLDYAGAEAQVVQLSRMFRGAGFVVQLISMIEPTAYLEELTAMGVVVLTLGMRKGMPDPRAVFRLRRLIRSFQPDVVHSHMVHANLLARVTRLFVRMPVLACTAHSIHEGGRFRTWLYRLTDRMCDVMTNVSQEAVNRYITIKASPPDKILLMPNGIDMERFSLSARVRVQIRRELGVEGRFVWLAVGRLAPEKDYLTMLGAFAEVRRSFPQTMLLIAGIGPEEAELKRYCREEGLEEQVRFLGLRTDIPDLMHGADAYLMSSKWEGLPMVLLEAGASGLPMVATDAGGNREIVQHGVNGYLSAPSDPLALAGEMLKLLGLTSSQQAAMGRFSQERIGRDYDIRAIARRWEVLYEQAERNRDKGGKLERGSGVSL
ncbi:glycosyltransferase [Paenibacillus physcomitrellae]|uniref:Glycosyl transferase family 1 n=1 Tax=Paenibacillus physcomitrellae TaxID=1619311 RepID=A0ABQ1G050_9BACL|nr:glycosyltransferase [Paenibacillus physcomitrellae]GGA33411.1 glycosyl transferase family 1 [Paenibacillus physcomitrellae]